MLPVANVPNVGIVVVCNCNVAALATSTTVAVNACVAANVTGFVPSPSSTLLPAPCTSQVVFIVAPVLYKLNVCPASVKLLGLVPPIPFVFVLQFDVLVTSLLALL